jgi:ribosomal protein S18 acetylase RimI-like enzyme
VIVRVGRPDDLPVLEELWRSFEAEVSPPAHVDVDASVELGEIRQIVESGRSWVAELDGAVVGMALARVSSPRLGRLTDLYVRPHERGRGVAKALVHEVVRALDDEGVEALDLEVMASNAVARAVYQRWGFQEDALTLVASVPALLTRLDPGADAASYGSIHVQTDDVAAVVRALEIYVPRLPGRSRGSVARPAQNGYVTVFDDACDRDPAMLRRLAREISTRTGLLVIALGVEEESVVRMILFDRGSVVDEYASVPEYHGPLPPGEVVALQANPVVVERYTGAAQAAVRKATPVGATPGELPPAAELVVALGAALGLPDVGHGWGAARGLDGAIVLDR